MDALDNVLADLGGKPTVGHNRAPAIEILRDELELENEPLLKRAADLAAAAGRMPEKVLDDETAGKFSDMVKLVAAAIKASEAGRVGKKEPFLEGGRAIDGFYKKRISDPLLAIKASVESRLGVYLRAKADRERRAREEAERLAREAERKAQEEARKAAEEMQNERDLQVALDAQQRAQDAAVASVAASKAAAAKPAEMARTRGDVGSLGTLRTHWTGEVVDRDTLDLGPLRQHLSLDDLNKAVRAYVKAGGRFLDGAKIYEAQEVTVR
jgi:hypothetical protein